MTAPSVDDIRRHLAEIPELCALLPDAAVARTVIEGPRPAPGSKPPTRLDVVHLLDTRDKHRDANMATCDPDRQGVLPYLWGWVRDIEADALDQSPQLPPESPEAPTVANCCDWLTTMLDYAATLPQWFEYADGIRRTHTNLRAATAGVRDIEERPVTCTTCGAGHLALTGPNLWECGACGKKFTVQAVTLRQAAKIIGDIGHTTLWRWSKRNLFTRIHDDGRDLYDLGSIRRVVAYERLEHAN